MSKPAYYVLTYASSIVGDRLIGLHSDPRLLREPHVVQPIWSTTLCIDPRFPARMYEHTFQVTLVSTTPAGMYLEWVAIEQQLRDGQGGEVEIQDENGNGVLDMGVCYYKSSPMVTPDKFLRTKAAHVEITMTSAEAPVAA